ncbi:amidase [Chryseolinea sp. T2]|uniref:amidase n=1 Tax=Chryseolinea sp. T2 TaxID=3129255 RepID=UPI0030788FCE
MKRRNFLSTGLLGLGSTMTILYACRETVKTTEQATTTPVEFPLEESDITSMLQQMKDGKLTSRKICELYLERIEQKDRNGPALNSVIEINPDALSIADERDRERAEGRLRGPLHGIPILIKDNIDTGDKMMTTAGALALEGNIASKDAFIIEQLRKSGAVVLGKTNLSEWANFRDERSSSGWSSRGGQTKNPYVLNRNPCGSSSGSGTAVAANLCAAAIGTETNGSIACPSSINGIVGIKPTVGLLSRNGIIPISHTQDTAGPMARTVTDAAILLSALVGPDPADPVTLKSEGHRLADYTSALDENGLNGKRLGFDKSVLGKHEGVDELITAALDALRSKGATIVDIDIRSKFRDMGSAPFTVLLFQFKDGVNKYLSTAHSKMKSLDDVISFNNQNAERAMPYFKQSILVDAAAKGDLNDKEYLSALQTVQKTTREGIDSVLKAEKLDAIIGPTNGPSWCTDHVNGDFFTGYGTYSPAAQAGYPHITVPMGLVSGLPIGLSFVGGAYQEASLITLAYAYEQVSHKRQKPEFTPSLS